MASHRPFRFSVQATTASSGAEWRELARRVEGAGYSALHLADHYVTPAVPSKTGGRPSQELAAMPAMAMAAAVTETLHIGCRVFCVDYHLPAVLAKSAATLDLLSDGRLELGLGAGWTQSEYAAMGVPFDAAGVRIERLSEVIALVKAQFSGEEIAMSGHHVNVSGYRGVGETDAHRPPIMIGGGSPRVLKLAGREADIVSFNFNNRAGVVGPDGVRSSMAGAMDDKIAWVREGAGDRFDQIELEIGAYFTVVTDQAAGMAAAMASRFGLEPDEMIEHPNALIGSVDEIVERLLARRERYGFSYVSVSSANLDVFAPVVAQLTGR